MLPVSIAGLLLMLLAAGFFVAEAFIVSHGALALAGAITFVIGALMLFDPAGDAYQVSLPVALAIAGTLALLFGFALTKAAQARGACRPRSAPTGSSASPARSAESSSSSTASSGRRHSRDGSPSCPASASSWRQSIPRTCTWS